MNDKNIQRSYNTGDDHKRSKLQSQSKEDRLSTIPDSLLVSILSLLSVEEAAATSVLSHRWTHLWTQITRLKLCYDKPRQLSGSYKTVLRSFLSTVNNTFQKLTSSKIHTFDLEFPRAIDDDIELCDSALQVWAPRVCALKVEEIRVSIEVFGIKRLLLVPTCIFQCQSLVVLHVENFQLPNNGIISLPNLKKLTLNRIRNKWDSDAMSTLFKSSILLEELDVSLWEMNEPASIDISCPNLRSLIISQRWMTHKCSKYVINAPGLEVIHIEDCIPAYFRLLETPFSLIKANIKLDGPRGGEEYNHGQLSEIIHWICYAKSLELSSTVLYPLIHLDDSALPRYSNLAQLHIYLNDDSGGYHSLLRCLRCAPNLEALVIEMSDGYEGVKWKVPRTVPPCLTSKLKKIEVKAVEGRKGELMILKYFLKHAEDLKLLLVGFLIRSTTQLGKEARFCSNLFGCPRISKACVIKFNGSFIQASSTNNQSPLTLNCQIQRLH